MEEKLLKVKKEVNIVTGEIRNKDPKYIDYDDYQYKRVEKYSNRTTNKEETFFNLIMEFQVSIKEKFGISFEDMGKILLLFTYTTYRDVESGKLYLIDHNHMFDNKKLGRVLKLNPTQIKKFKQRMSQKGIMKTDSKGMYFTQELIIRGEMFSKERKELDFYTIYDQPIRELYNIFAIQDDTKSVKPLGVLLTMIPFIKKVSIKEKKDNKQSSNNMLVMTQWNEAANRYEPISLNQLAEKIGISKPTLIKDIKTLNDFTKKNTGEFLVYKYENSIMPVGYKFKYTTEAIVINPKYTYSQSKDNKEYNNLIEAIQNISESDSNSLPFTEK